MGLNKGLNLSDISCTEQTELTETFYVNNKKNTVFQVSLSEKGFCLKKITNNIVKERLIEINDIVGSHCMRSKKKSRTNIGSCACSSPNVKDVKSVFDEGTSLDASGEASNVANEDTNCDSSAYLYVYAYVLKKSLRNHLKRERTVLTLRFRSFDKYDDNNREALKWHGHIKRLRNIQTGGNGLNSMFSSQNKVLVILNPKSGAGKARELFHQEVVPIFVEAEISYDLYVTKYANYAKEFMRSKDMNNWRGIIVVGGDGIYYEVINGLMQRQDWREIFERISIGTIPCGSGNGLAKSISFSNNEPYEPKPILSAALTAVRGKTAPMDLVRVETRSQIMFSFLSIGWGLISDIDIESERIRTLGYQRFTVWSVHRLISLRTYHGKLSYLPKTSENSEKTDNSNNTSNNISSSNHKHNLSIDTTFSKTDSFDSTDSPELNEYGEVISLETSASTEFFRQRGNSWYSATSRKSAYFSIAESLYQSIDGRETGSAAGEQRLSQQNTFQTYGPSPNAPSLMSPVPDTWTTEEGEYVMVHAAYQSHLGTDIFFAPSAKLSDGTIWLVVIRSGVSRSQLLNFLLNLSSGTHLPSKSNEFIKIIPVSAFRIEPTGTEGIITVDGERVEYGVIQGEIFPNIVNVMVP
ncbi:sphingosine kinase 2 [Episyrphus balteatus]|uniref:sphingosine kinase 2 n=1 Tax=Episyrphus balteatus TaxID=286459 RepID=UPI0024864443|nr:sphingosine kinase 2 [Episyrphus balteatus]